MAIKIRHIIMSSLLLTALPSGASAQILEDCTTQDIDMDISFEVGPGTAGGSQHFGFNRGIIESAGDFLQDVANALCTLFPCGGTGGESGGEGTGGGEETPPTEDPPAETPVDEPGESENPPAGDGNESCSAGVYGDDTLLDKIVVQSSTYQNGAFHIVLKPGTKVKLANINVRRPFLLPAEVKEGSGLIGNWYLVPGEYPVRQNRLTIPVKKR